MPYARMDSATSYSFGMIQQHRNVLGWYYHHCTQGQWTSFILSMMNITVTKWKIYTILLLFARQLKIKGLKRYAMVHEKKNWQGDPKYPNLVTSSVL